MSKSLTLYIIEYIVWIVIVTMFLFPVVKPAVSLSGDNHHHAGYYNYGMEDEPWFPMMGVSGDIRAIDRDIDITNSDFYAGFVAVIIRYFPVTDFVQTGYDNYDEWKWWWYPFFGYWALDQFKFYIEKWDNYGHTLTHFGSPVDRTTYNFLLSNVEMDYTWEYEIRQGSTLKNSGNIVVGGKSGVDVQAFVETSDIAIDIGDVRFNNLKYMFGYNNWFNWDRHVPYVISPYVLIELSHTMFLAYRGD